MAKYEIKIYMDLVRKLRILESIAKTRHKNRTNQYRYAKRAAQKLHNVQISRIRTQYTKHK